MYSHPIIVEGAARHHQDELLRYAQEARLARMVHEGEPGRDQHSTGHHRLVAAAVAMLMLLSVAALI